MKLLILLGLVSLTLAVPQPRKAFHEHFFDFVSVIAKESGDELDHILGHYFEFEEFRTTFAYLRTANFKDVIYEMESLPEFTAVIDFLENDNIDIHFFIDILNDIIGTYEPDSRKSRHVLAGTDFSAFIQDSIATFPKEKLAALYEQKIEEDEEFRVAVENLSSDEWKEVSSALLESETFKKEVQILEENGINLSLLFEEFKAIFGQN